MEVRTETPEAAEGGQKKTMRCASSSLVYNIDCLTLVWIWLETIENSARIARYHPKNLLNTSETMCDHYMAVWHGKIEF